MIRARVLTGLAILVVGAGIWLLSSSSGTGGQTGSGLRLAPDHGGAIELAVTAVNSARHSALRNAGLVTQLANDLPESAELLVLTDDRESMHIAAGRRAGRVQLIPVPAGKRITIWPQDPFLVMHSARSEPVLLASRTFDRADDAAMASTVAGTLGWRVLRRPRRD